MSTLNGSWLGHHCLWVVALSTYISPQWRTWGHSCRTVLQWKRCSHFTFWPDTPLPQSVTRRSAQWTYIICRVVNSYRENSQRRETWHQCCVQLLNLFFFLRWLFIRHLHQFMLNSLRCFMKKKLYICVVSHPCSSDPGAVYSRRLCLTYPAPYRPTLQTASRHHNPSLDQQYPLHPPSADGGQATTS